MTEPLRLLVCGGREYDDDDRAYAILDRIREKYGVVVVIEGGARGADAIARRWAVYKLLPIITEKADGLAHPKAAGPIRNLKMLRDHKPTYVLALPGGRGTAHMVARSQEAGVKTLIVPPR